MQANSINSSRYEPSDFSLWEEGSIQLVLRAGGYYIPDVTEGGLHICLNKQSCFSFLSRMNAVLCFYFDARSFEAGELTVTLGEQVLLSQDISQDAQCRAYFAISPGANDLSFNFCGNRHFSIFNPKKLDSRILDFKIINPQVEVISY